jgi:beta-lactamase superfamily II metal-dependent hydrolase
MCAATKKKKKTTTKAVTITMYDVGFGDCFLVRFPAPAGEKRILFDCGSIKAGTATIDDVVSSVISDVTDADGNAKIDVVVATHRHKDHVSGFDNEAWAAVEVGEVWMPWTEHPTDPKARNIRDRMNSLALHLQTLAGTGGVQGPLTPAAISEIALNALSNEAAMRTLHRGFAGNPRRRFLAANNKGESMATITSDVLPSVTINVLGPSRDEEVIKDMDPPVGQSYLRLVDDTTGNMRATLPPFDNDWTIDSGEYAISFPELVVNDADAAAIRRSAEGLEGIVAAAIDKAVNGTSLMIVLHIGKLSLLFPGDAQWGTWNAALENPDARDVLSEATFCKLGHHGSHNASPVDFVEHVLQKSAWVMVSTRHVDQWPNIPRTPLMTALAAKTDKLARSDQPQTVPVKWFKSAKGRTTAEIPLT